ncbi:MAG: cupin domain-containing protein [Rubrivivax sp.]|nr:cupin domain-containing protein [Rubrivivax sp.]
MTAPIVNIADVELVPRPAEHLPTGPAASVFAASTGRVSRRIGAVQLGYNITAVAPGRAAYPFHSHRVNEEMFFILQGQGEIRLGNQTHRIRVGDFIACPAGGPDTAHRITNTGLDELRYLAVSTARSPEICEYPDSGKFGVYAEFRSPGDAAVEPFYFMGREELMLDYWDGEGSAPGAV